MRFGRAKREFDKADGGKGEKPTRKGGWFRAAAANVGVVFGEVDPGEADAARIYALSYNRLDPEVLIAALAEHAVWESQSAIRAMQGKLEIADYLRGKMKTISEGGAAKMPYFELGSISDMRGASRPCVVCAQGNRDKPLAVVLFKTENKQIKRVDMCTVSPRPDRAIRSGEYPQ
jgi:hypothetical protein